MPLERSILGRWAVALAGLCSTLGCGAPPMPPYAPRSAPTVSANGPIVLLGDTQRTSWVETALGREQNETARRALIDKIAREERPAFVVHLGDMVVTGSDAESWEYFDRLVSPLTVRKIPILPVLGNHDYWGDDRAALAHARSRFPQLISGGRYAMRHRGLGLVWLDSNLTGAAARAQASWFSRMLAAFEGDPFTRGVIAFTHHPPYTNGKQRSGDDYVRSQLLPSFLRAHKTVAMMSGHVHGYERFQIDGRAFVVSGGAGGPRVEYRTGPELEPPPAYVTADGRPRAFHYVVVQDSNERLDFTVKCLKLDARCNDGILERFSLALPAPP